MAKPYDPREPMLTFHDARAKFLADSDTPRAYLERCLATIEAREPEVKAFVAMNIEGARQAANASTKRYRERSPLSLIDGMPIGIKDLYETSDMPTQMGSPLFKNFRPWRDCAAVFALRQSGAVVLGKTVTTELGFYHPGPTRNPFDARRTPGGSSSGSAAAVSAKMVPVALASQVVGSLIRPSSYCGNVGFKPSFGALNRGGGGTGLSQAVIGMQGGSLEDVWSVSRQIARLVGGDPGFPGLFGAAELSAMVKPQRLIRVNTAGWNATSAAARDAFERAVKHLADRGVEIVTAADDRRVAQFEAEIRHAIEITDVLCGYELRWSLLMYRSRGPESLSDTMLSQLTRWEKLSNEDYQSALTRRAELRGKHAALESIGSALLTLSAPGAAPVGMNTGDPVFAAPSSVLGAPAISLPLLTVDDMPLGLQLIGQPDSDARLAGIARWVAVAGFGGREPRH
jgi:Asp-tRNA(Asn)/Glu-tRNA(Gln) amidotransferase A subunit family amidase